ncbi:hypothetical protein PR048_019992 [Dryococelus australis]|uniref:Uncharacterized protein n=1 Tax=Dryococelus australis TaxID=614101 RepID=A0ABQ9H540_9NEOP|nr:hypothetical protein PR048_019992 [Dryococelus australis]
MQAGGDLKVGFAICRWAVARPNLAASTVGQQSSSEMTLASHPCVRASLSSEVKSRPSPEVKMKVTHPNWPMSQLQLALLALAAGLADLHHSYVMEEPLKRHTKLSMLRFEYMPSYSCSHGWFCILHSGSMPYKGVKQLLRMGAGEVAVAGSYLGLVGTRGGHDMPRGGGRTNWPGVSPRNTRSCLDKGVGGWEGRRRRLTVLELASASARRRPQADTSRRSRPARASPRSNIRWEPCCFSLSPDILVLKSQGPRWLSGYPARLPPRVTPGLSQVGIVPDDSAGRRVSSGLSRFPDP